MTRREEAPHRHQEGELLGSLELVRMDGALREACAARVEDEALVDGVRLAAHEGDEGPEPPWAQHHIGHEEEEADEHEADRDEVDVEEKRGCARVGGQAWDEEHAEREPAEDRHDAGQGQQPMAQAGREIEAKHAIPIGVDVSGDAAGPRREHDAQEGGEEGEPGKVIEEEVGGCSVTTAGRLELRCVPADGNRCEKDCRQNREQCHSRPEASRPHNPPPIGPSAARPRNGCAKLQAESGSCSEQAGSDGSLSAKHGCLGHASLKIGDSGGPADPVLRMPRSFRPSGRSSGPAGSARRRRRAVAATDAVRLAPSRERRGARRPSHF